MIVVDCSLVVDSLTRRELAPVRVELAGHRLHAPALLDYEVSSAFRLMLVGQRLSHHRAMDALADFLDLGIRKHPPTRDLVEAAWHLRDHMTVYDGAYVALAQALGVPLWTMDAGLARAASAVGNVQVVVPEA